MFSNRPQFRGALIQPVAFFEKPGVVPRGLLSNLSPVSVNTSTVFWSEIPLAAALFATSLAHWGVSIFIPSITFQPKAPAERVPPPAATVFRLRQFPSPTSMN